MAKKATRRGHKSSNTKAPANIVNRRASFDYQLDDDLVVGLELTGAETKSARLGHVQLRGSYVVPKTNQSTGKTELFLINASFSLANHTAKVYGQPTTTVDTRARRLLAKRREIDRLVEQKNTGQTIVPTKLLTTGRYVKLVIALGKGKKRYDKRETIKRREASREASRQIKRA